MRGERTSSASEVNFEKMTRAPHQYSPNVRPSRKLLLGETARHAFLGFATDQ